MSKFDDAIDEYVYTETADESAGDSSEGAGWYGLFRGPFAREEGTDLSDEDWEFLTAQAGAIAFEETTGFVSVEYYETTEALDEAWAKVEEAHAEPDEDGGDYTTNDEQRFYQHGKRVVTVPEGEDWKAAVKAHMDAEQFWPDVWLIEERGGHSRLSLAE